MRRKFAIGIAIFLAACALAVLAGCGTVDYDKKYADRAKVVFELEGGRYKNFNGVTQVKHYYQLDESGTCKIIPLKLIDEENGEDKTNGLTHEGDFTFLGWFRTKTVVDDEVEYSDEWDFDNDTVTKDGVTLYAKWKEQPRYTFAFYYLDENGEEVFVKSYNVGLGNTLSIIGTDYLALADYRSEYTPSAIYYDKECTVPFDDSMPHPGHPDGIEKSYEVKLYVQYIQGAYKFVRTAEDLMNYGDKGIFLLADIDLNGAEFSLTDFNGKTLIGNGHKISNFKVAYVNDRSGLLPDLENDSRKSLYISIFGNAENVVVKDVTFENISVVVDTFLSTIYKIYVAPLATQAKGCTFENVAVTGTFGYTKATTKPKVFVTDSGFVYKDESTTDNGCTFDITNLGVVTN